MNGKKDTERIKSVNEDKSFVAFGKGINKYVAIAVISVVAVVALLILVVIIAAFLQSN